MYNWQVATPTTTIPEWMKKYNLDPIIYRILESRGLTEEIEVEKFLRPNLDRDEYDPYLMSGMKAAIERLQYALDKQERILIHGDYDADGLTSTALVYRALRSRDADVVTFIPTRGDGYGLQKAGVDCAAEQGATLIITVDCGITSCDEVNLAASLGIDVIITDHHTPPAVLPEALAIVNPKLANCSYPFKDLAGVGVAYKVMQALVGKEVRQWLPLVAIGSIGDLVPLRDENRLFCWEGLRRLNASPLVGLSALVDVAGLTGQELGAGQVGFALAPRLNAAGRLSCADLPLQLLLEDNADHCRAIAEELDRLNKERQEVESALVEEATALVSPGIPAIVLYTPGWQHGVVGIAASRLVEKFYRPAILLGRDDDGLLRGSGRSISGFNLVEALRKCEHLLERCGGHAMAAGLSLREENFPAFVAAFTALAEAIPEDLFTRQLKIDASIDLKSLNEEWINNLQLLAPFGMGNPNPTFSAEGLVVSEKRAVGRNRDHLRLLVKGKDSPSFGAIMFGRADRLSEIRELAGLNVAFRPTMDEYMGKPQISLRLQDFYSQTDKGLWLVTNPNLADDYFSQLPDELKMLFFTAVHQFPVLLLRKDRHKVVPISASEVKPAERAILLTPFLGGREMQALPGIDYLRLDGLVYNREEILQYLAPERAELADFYRFLTASNGQLHLDEYVTQLPRAAVYSRIRGMMDVFMELDLLEYSVRANSLSYGLVPQAPRQDLANSQTYLALSTWRCVK